jgi:hypothetical protein
MGRLTGRISRMEERLGRSTWPGYRRPQDATTVEEMRAYLQALVEAHYVWYDDGVWQGESGPHEAEVFAQVLNEAGLDGDAIYEEDQDAEQG